MRYGYSVDPQYREQARKERGEWVEEEPGMRDFTELVDRLTPEELDRRDLTEQKALQRSQAVPEIAKLVAFRRRAAVRHYAEPPSPLLDVTSDIEVAAFFATGSGQPVKEGYGLISAISLEFVAQLFQLDPIRVQGGWTVVGRPRLHEWGDNVKMLRDQKLEVTQLEITAVDLPFRRPQAQKALFLTLDGPAEGRIDTRSELLWWSMLERWSWSVGFIQNAECYRNESKEITAEHLLPQDIQI